MTALLTSAVEDFMQIQMEANLLVQASNLQDSSQTCPVLPLHSFQYPLLPHRLL